MYIICFVNSENDDTVWEWQNDDKSGWVQYSVEVSRFIEQERCCGNTVIDLSQKFGDLPYIIDLTQMTQKRKETGRLRFIRTQPAHFDPTNLSVPGSWSPISFMVRFTWIFETRSYDLLLHYNRATYCH